MYSASPDIIPSSLPFVSSVHPVESLLPPAYPLFRLPLLIMHTSVFVILLLVVDLRVISLLLPLNPFRI
jgi:hypothetical protein